MALRECRPGDFEDIFHVINDAAKVYEGVIPSDMWQQPYMPRLELKGEVEAGVRFYGWFDGGGLVGVMGIQRVRDVTLIRHAYVLTEHQRSGIGGRLLAHLKELAETPTLLVGTWAAATWAVRFYEKHGFHLVSEQEKNRLLRGYWRIPERQVETSVVLKLG
jgi:GNAT superfamily N-acetyltransferase